MKEDSQPEVRDCPFCNTDTKEMAFMTSDHFRAIYNIFPVLPGHSLVISDRHVKSLMQLTEEELVEFTVFSRKVTGFLLQVFKGDGFDWSLQENLSAGQSVPHLHLHIVVRNPGDLDEKGEWYPLVRSNEITLLESQFRQRMHEQEYLAMTELLRHQAAKFL